MIPISKTSIGRNCHYQLWITNHQRKQKHQCKEQILDQSLLPCCCKIKTLVQITKIRQYCCTFIYTNYALSVLHKAASIHVHLHRHVHIKLHIVERAAKITCWHFYYWLCFWTTVTAVSVLLRLLMQEALVWRLWCHHSASPDVDLIAEPA